MKIIIDVFAQALTDINLSYVILLDCCVMALYIFNIILGTILGTKEEGFDVKKFLFGVMKSFMIVLIILGVCYILNVFVLVMNMMETITISTDMITTIEIIGVLVAVIVDLAMEIKDKLKSFKEMKYVSFDDVIISDTNVTEPTELKG